MNLKANRTRMEMLTKELLRQWAETRTTWNDVKAIEFEQKYIQELTGRVAKAASVIEKMDELLNKVRGDCE